MNIWTGDVVSDTIQQIERLKKTLSSNGEITREARREILSLFSMLECFLNEQWINETIYYGKIKEILNNILLHKDTFLRDKNIVELKRLKIINKKENNIINDIISIFWLYDSRNENLDILEQKIILLAFFVDMGENPSLLYSQRINNIKGKTLNLDKNSLVGTWMSRLPSFQIQIDQNNEPVIKFEEGETELILDKYSRK